MAKFPSRPGNSLPASQFMQSLGNSSSRDSIITTAIIQGNFPEFLRALVPVTVTEGENTLVYNVMPDYLALGDEADYVRVPLGAQAAQQIADAFDCTLPTPKMSDQIWKAAAAKLPPQPMSGRTSNIGGKNYTAKEFVAHKMSDTDSFYEHNRLVQDQLKGAKPGQLVAGHKKDVVISNQLADHPNRLGIHGMHDASGKPIQGGSLSMHDINYRDYSHGIRLIDKVAILNGKPINLISGVLQNPKFAGLVSNEGAVTQLAYNYKPNSGQQVATNGKPPAANRDLFQQLEEYLSGISKLV